MERRELGGYELREVLGEGGMGTVYRAQDLTLDRPAAVKVIRAKSLSREGKERFLREARACSRINHPNIITVYAAGEEDGEPYMAMELIDGETLRDVINKGPIDWRTSTRWIIALLDALQRLHAEGIVHRDLKPENIMVTRDGIIKLMDFGLAHLTTQTAITQEGTTLGTVPYMSPEQVLGRRLDARSDLFSIATIFHEMITGMHPFRGDHPMAVMYSIRNETPRPIKLESSDYPVGLQGVLDRAFEKELDKRFADAGAFRDAILAVAPELTGTTVIERKSSPVRMALTVGIVSAVVFGVGLTGWNFVQGRRAAANRAEAQNLNERALLAEDASAKEDLLRQALQKDPTYAPPYNELGFMAMEAGYPVIADSMYRESLKRNPHFGPALLNIGNRFFDQSQYDSAAVFYERAMRGESPDSAIVANQLAAVYLRMGRPEDARGVLEAVIALPEPRAMVRGYQLMNLGKALAAEGDSTAARERWHEARAVYPDIPELRELLPDPGL
jgi:serine/threonine protein kinase